MRFITPPENQGQIIEVSYACAGEEIIKRVHDRSDRSTSYYSAPVEGDDWQWYETYEPTNGAPPISDWKLVTEQYVRRLEEQ